MKRIKKIIALTLAAAMVVPTFAGCQDGGGGNGGEGGLTSDAKDWYTAYARDEDVAYNEDTSFNQDLYYLNEFKYKIADPDVIYVDKGEEAGYFYAYGTSDLIGGAGIQCWRSKDLTNWEYKSAAYVPDFDHAWNHKNHWAPEVIYDEESEGYLMFFNADYGALDSADTPWFDRGNNHKYISVVYSQQPYGPFVEITDRTLGAPAYDFSANNGIINNKDRTLSRSNAIDAHPFVDPATGDKYLYYSGYGFDGNNEWHGQTIFGVKMKNGNWLDPDYSTVTELTNLYKTEVGLGENNLQEGQDARETVNEGAFVWMHNGKYYLTFSVYAFTNPSYQVRQAIGDSPLGPFIKLQPSEGGSILSTEISWEGKIQSAGHHCFITCGDELMIAYHSFYNRMNIDEARAIAIDTVSWVKNETADLNKDGTPDDIELMHVNGPTYSYQPLPEEISGYTNLAPLATVTSDNTAAGSDVKYLTDGLIKAHRNDLVKEYETKDSDSDTKNSRTEIKLTFDKYVNVRSIMIYNSIDLNHIFTNISSISLSTKKGVRTISNVPFDMDWHLSKDYAVIPGANSIVEFAEMAVNEITITVYGAPGEPVNINEIKVLGRNVESTAGSGYLKSYKYSAHDPVEAMPYYESENFGRVTDFYGPGQHLYSTYGFDLSHDESDHYVDKTWAGNMQEIYFKEVNANILYVEVEMSVMDHRNTYNFDPAPKAGIVLRTKNKTFISYNIDYQSTFDTNFVGYVESNTAGTDYYWEGYKSYQAPGISYTGTNYVKLGLARINDLIYMFANGNPVAMEGARLFNDDASTSTAVGFVAFNVFTRYKNYSVITEESAVKAKLASLGVTV